MNLSYGLHVDIGKGNTRNRVRTLVKTARTGDRREFGLFALIDGTGNAESAKSGEKASEIAVNCLKRWWNYISTEGMLGRGFGNISNQLKNQFYLINSFIRSHGRSRGIQLSAGLSAVFVADGRYYLCHMGGACLYKLNTASGYIKQLTVESSDSTELVKVRQSFAQTDSADLRQNIVSKYLGLNPEIQVFQLEGDVGRRDILLLCSEGLRNEISSQQIKNVVLETAEHNSSAQYITEHLTRTAVEKGGRDNVSAIVLWDNWKPLNINFMLPDRLREAGDCGEYYSPDLSKIFSACSNWDFLR